MSMQQGLGVGQGSVQDGSRLLDPAARATLGQFASGENIGGNPHLDAAVGRATDQIRRQFKDKELPELNATFGGAGRTGSGLHAQTAGQAWDDASQAMGDTASRMYGQAYDQGRQRQLAAAGQLGGLGVQGSQLGLQGAGLGSNMFNQGQNRQLVQNQLGANIFSQSQGRQQEGNRLAEQMFAGDQNLQLGANQLSETGVCGGSRASAGGESASGVDVQPGAGSSAGGESASRVDVLIRGRVVSRWRISKRGRCTTRGRVVNSLERISIRGVDV